MKNKRRPWWFCSNVDHHGRFCVFLSENAKFVCDYTADKYCTGNKDAFLIGRSVITSDNTSKWAEKQEKQDSLRQTSKQDCQYKDTYDTDQRGQT